MDGRNNGFSQSVLCKSGSYKAILSEHDARIFRDEPEGFFVSQEKIRAHLASANEHLAREAEPLRVAREADRGGAFGDEEGLPTLPDRPGFPGWVWEALPPA